MSLDAPAAATPAARLPVIDAARGAAILAMIVYHFSWDLRYFGFIAVDVTEALGWRIFARLIAGTFLFLVGFSLVLAARRGFDRRKCLRRLGLVAGAAVAITAVTYSIMPEAFIFFGILHCIALTSVLGVPFTRAPLPVVVAAAFLCFMLPHWAAAPIFDSPALLWLGLFTVPPRSNDLVPLFPWFGVVLAGIAAARLLPTLRSRWAAGRTLGAPAPAPLAWAGRHSLAIYLIHQPVLFGLVYLAAQVSPPNLLAFEDSFIESCTASCVESELEAAQCGGTCACIADGAQAAGLWRPLMQSALDAEQTNRYFEIADACRAPRP